MHIFSFYSAYIKFNIAHFTYSPSMQIIVSLFLSLNSQAAAILIDHLLTIAMRNAAKFWRRRHMLFWL